jgi:putative transposase
MASWAVHHRRLSIVIACRTFGISETCYRYKPKLSDEDELIADWLLALTKANKNWGFGLCYSHLRIKPCKRLKREKPGAMTVPGSLNHIWSMDFMADQLADVRPFWTLNGLYDFSREGLTIEVDVSLPSERLVRTLDQVIR